jgi:predicted Zn-dependent protease
MTILSIAPPEALANDFLLCNQRPRSHESAASIPPLAIQVGIASGSSQDQLHQAAVGCSTQLQLVPAGQSGNEGRGDSPNDEEDIPVLLATYQQLVANNSNLLLHRVEKFFITSDSKPNAFIRQQSNVVITKGLLAEIHQSDDLAFVLAHELAHMQLKHTRSASIEHEREADAYAINLIEQAGFSPCGVPDLLSRVLAAGGRSEKLSRPRTQPLSDAISATCNHA